jgi:hypothetical protein
VFRDWEGDLSQVTQALQKVGVVPVKHSLAMPIFFRRLFLKNFQNMFLYFEAGGPKGTPEEFKRVVPETVFYGWHHFALDPSLLPNHIVRQTLGWTINYPCGKILVMNFPPKKIEDPNEDFVSIGLGRFACFLRHDICGEGQELET